MVIQYLAYLETLWLDSNSYKTAVERKYNFWVNKWNNLLKYEIYFKK